jgi:hypothetical protein
MGIDATAASITLVDPETGKGRVTYLCEGRPERAFQPTPGLWFSNQSEEVRARACARAVARCTRVPGAQPRWGDARAEQAPPPNKVLAALEAEYKRDPYPSADDLARIAKQVGAPGVTQVRRRGAAAAAHGRLAADARPRTRPPPPPGVHVLPEHAPEVHQRRVVHWTQPRPRSRRSRTLRARDEPAPVLAVTRP